MDQTMIGETVVKLMDELPDEVGEEDEIVAVGIVVVVDADSREYIRIKTTPDGLHNQLGLFHAALWVAESDEED